MNKAIPLLLILILVSTALLLLLAFTISASADLSPFLIAATIVASVALLGAVFSLYTENRCKNRI